MMADMQKEMNERLLIKRGFACAFSLYRILLFLYKKNIIEMRSFVFRRKQDVKK